MSNQFRDSLAVDVMIGYDSAHTGSEYVAVADAVLRSPEMQQIKTSLNRLAHFGFVVSGDPEDDEDAYARMMLRRVGLSPHVIEWVLG